MNFKKKVSGVWHDIPHYIHNTSTDTITTLPADIYANDTTATVGLKGNMSQSGTPTPQNPIQPSECGERTGNLWSANSTISKERSPSYYAAYLETPLPTGTYTFSAKVSGEEGVTACRVSFRKSNMGQIVASNIEISSDRTSITVTLSEPCYAVYMYGSNDTTTLAVVTYQDIMLNTGSTPLPFEPYGIKIPISSANTTTPVYLGEVETTRKVKKLVLTAEETINGDIGYNRFIFTLPDMRSEGVRLTKLFCTHYQNISDGRPIANVPDNSIYTGGGADSQKVFIKTTDYTTVADFKAYLAAQYAAGTPVTVWYVLATPTTGIVNEPIRKIGTYADGVSGITIPTITGKDSFDVQTTLKPSEVSLAYTGWHDATVKEWDGSEWQ